MKQVNNLNGAGELFIGNIPYPLRSISDNHLSFRLTEASPGHFPFHPLGKFLKAIHPHPP
jgi:hypothetical protein